MVDRPSPLVLARSRSHDEFNASVFHGDLPRQGLPAADESTFPSMTPFRCIFVGNQGTKCHETLLREKTGNRRSGPDKMHHGDGMAGVPPRGPSRVLHGHADMTLNCKMPLS